MASKDKAAEIRPTSALRESRWEEAQFVQARHSIRPEPATPYGAVLAPEYFANIAKKLREGDIIEVRPAEGSYYAELYVWARGDNWAQVSEIIKRERPATAGVQSDIKDFSIEFVDGDAKHRVIRNSDRVAVASGFGSVADANKWIKANGKQIAT